MTNRGRKPLISVRFRTCYQPVLEFGTLWGSAVQIPHLNLRIFSHMPRNLRHLLELTRSWYVAAGPVPVSSLRLKAWSCTISHTSSPKWRQRALIPNTLSWNVTSLICTFISTFAVYLRDLRDPQCCLGESFDIRHLPFSRHPDTRGSFQKMERICSVLISVDSLLCSSANLWSRLERWLFFLLHKSFFHLK